MEKSKSEFIQTVIFSIILIGQLFLASRYWPRQDYIGTAIFLVVAVLSGIAAFGHFLEWKKAKNKA